MDFMMKFFFGRTKNPNGEPSSKIASHKWPISPFFSALLIFPVSIVSQITAIARGDNCNQFEI